LIVTNGKTIQVEYLAKIYAGAIKAVNDITLHVDKRAILSPWT
jgi:hypothetical protein